MMTTNDKDLNDEPPVDPSDASNDPLEAERTVSVPRQCAGCGAVITKKRRHANYCSDKCRAEESRRKRSERIAAYFLALEQTIAQLKTETGVASE
jgi:predicted nucleic acid-binding Zn ribbon protein